MANRLDPEKATTREWGLRQSLHEARERVHDLEEALRLVISCSKHADVVAIAKAALGPPKKEIR